MSQSQTRSQSKPASTMKTFRLSDANYYSREANQHYMSATLFKQFLACEAEALAELRGVWTLERSPTALLVGNYLHSYFESPEAHQEFIKANAWSIYKPRAATKKDEKDGVEIREIEGKDNTKKKIVLTNEMYADYPKADKMIKVLDDDQTFRKVYQGNKEEILTGEIGGMPWMGKVDCFDPTKSFFLDLKTTEDLHKRHWIQAGDRGHWGSFVEAYSYPLQMAVYQELIRQNYGTRPAPILVAVTKQDPPDKAFVAIPQDDLDEAMQQLLDAQPRIEQVIAGETNPYRCEQCDYCRATKHLGQIISMNELIE
ncbi:PD-(D/E)XK nuclease-like domain-containing protein [Schleiferilactobacillus harbinensis]|nr:PD-(D/E)XK nuclease-like domain-containing protein [Schleiferilactobacillus harbinensis]